LPNNLERPEATIPAQAIKYMNKLFKIEQELEQLSANERINQRLEQEKPELKAFGSWAKETAPKILLKSKLAEAFRYAFNHKEGLMTYLEDGNCSISNNLSENSIRPFTIGRNYVL
jgi:hypothetical protein